MPKAEANSRQNFAEHLTENYKDLEGYTGKDSIVSLEEMAEIVKLQHKPKIIHSGFSTFDKEVHGFAPGELIAISGPRKAGKTLYAQSLTRTFSKNGVKSLWFSYEISPAQFIERFPEIPKQAYAPKTMKANSLDWLRDRIMEAMAKNAIGVVFVDHLHYLLDLAKINNVSLELGQVVRYIKRLAVELNLIIFVMCHLTKINPYKEPSDTDIRDSSFVSQESDMGIMIWREQEENRKGNVIGLDTAWMKICYDRRMGTIERKIKLIKRNGLLEEFATNVAECAESQMQSYENRRYPD